MSLLLRKVNDKITLNWEDINPKKYSKEVPPHSILTFIMTQQSFQALSSVKSMAHLVIQFLTCDILV